MLLSIWNKGNGHLYMVVGVQTWIATMEINVAVPQEEGTRSTSRSNYTILGHLPKERFFLSQGRNFVHYYSIHKPEVENSLDVPQQKNW